MSFNVTVLGDKWWRDRVYYLSRGGIGREAITPAFRDLDRKIRATLTELFRPRTNVASGETYAHGDTGAYLSNLHSVVTESSLQIIEGTSIGGGNIREGGPGGQYIDIVAWARRKLGVDEANAERIAKSVRQYGIGRPGGKSPLLDEPPQGEGRFAFPEWIVTEKNREDIDRVADTVDKLVVRYLS